MDNNFEKCAQQRLNLLPFGVWTNKKPPGRNSISFSLERRAEGLSSARRRLQDSSVHRQYDADPGQSRQESVLVAKFENPRVNLALRQAVSAGVDENDPSNHLRRQGCPQPLFDRLYDLVYLTQTSGYPLQLPLAMDGQCVIPGVRRGLNAGRTALQLHKLFLLPGFPGKSRAWCIAKLSINKRRQKQNPQKRVLNTPPSKQKYEK